MYGGYTTGNIRFSHDRITLKKIDCRLKNPGIFPKLKSL